MGLNFKRKKIIKHTLILTLALLSGTIVFWSVSGDVWATFNFQILDLFYRQAVKYGYGPKLSPQIVYINITDHSYDYFGKNVLDRADLAKVNDALASYNPASVAYDIIFARSSSYHADKSFAKSLENLGPVYLPIGIDYVEHAHSFRWEEGASYERLRSDYLKKPIEKGVPRPYYATRALMQVDNFSEVAFNSGHIGISSDSDGVYRHFTILVKVDSLYLPALALSMFLDYARATFDEIIVDWGHQIVIPATKENLLESDVLIPIDDRGRAVIPYAQVWNQDFEKMATHTLLQYHGEKGLQGNLRAFFEGKFVFIGDISVGIADLGQTPLEDDVPLLTVHASLLNGFLNNTFYRKWSFSQTLSSICLMGVILSVSVLLRPAWLLYVMGGIISVVLIYLTWIQLINFVLLPIVTVAESFLFMFFGLIIGLQVVILKDRAFIRHAFAKYVNEKVMNELLEHPELLQLGGEERVLTVLFADLEGFSTISEKMSPTDLVHWLNEYLTEMTDIIVAEDGIIDRYIGDAILAEFGAPLPLHDHADRAVRAGLTMQRRLRELNDRWRKKGLPQARCRIGINTGPMVIGNLGSRQVFNYTVTGDAANLGARLESANKFYNTYFIISEFTFNHIMPDSFQVRLLDVVKVKGKSQSVKIFEVYNDSLGVTDQNHLLYYQTYHEAFKSYLSRDFAVARERFVAASSLWPADPAAKGMIARIDALKPDDLPDDWDGSVALLAK
jgi:adenylate cyclase